MLMAENSNVTNREILKEGLPWYWWFHGVSAVTSVLGNLLVIFLILTRSSLRTTPNWFVLSLAVADFLVGAVVFPLRLVFEVVFQNRPTSNYFVNVVDYFLLKASMTNLCVLTLNRYLSIMYPLKHVYLKKKYNVIKLILTAWFIAFLFPLIFLLLNLFVKDALIKRYYIMFLLIFLEIVPCVALTLAYLHIIYFARRQREQIKKQKSQLKHNYPTRRVKERYKKNKTMIRVLGGVIGFFVLSYLVDISRVWLKYIDLNEATNTSLLSKISFLLLYANSAVNVFFYGLFKKDFRAEIWKMFCELFSRGKDPSRSFFSAEKKTTKL
ncbi:adenosine receptor A2a-like [Actinia tenebrosa]|uniref:Adenosine receptor A2a-like n=1 Tax=Actinia tenebrosa TaxID=6105 RepID=A0A6P8ISA6_ACTTE|nr:adenosine receptor A2a-like [Actinia tenebrosa]